MVDDKENKKIKGKQKKSDKNNGVEELLVSENARQSLKKRSLLIREQEKVESEFIGVVSNDDCVEKVLFRVEEEKKKQNEESEKEPILVAKFTTKLEWEEHYVHCMKIVNSNKVTRKNAFNLQVIDYMKVALPYKFDNLSLMSCTLDASAKVYAYRVDKAYADMVKAISGKFFDKDDDEEDESDENNDEEDPSKKKKKKKKNQDIANLQLDKMLCHDERQLDKTDNHEGESIFKDKTTLPLEYEYFLQCPITDPDCELTINAPLFWSEEETGTNQGLRFAKYEWTSVSVDLLSSLPDYKEILDTFHVVDCPSVPVNNPMDVSLAFDANEDIPVDDYHFNEDEEHGACAIDSEPCPRDYDDCHSEEEAPPEAPPEVPPNAPPEVPPNAPPEVPPNATPEVPPNAPPEVPPNAPPEVPPNAPPEVPPNATPEVPHNAPPEAPAISTSTVDIPKTSFSIKAMTSLVASKNKDEYSFFDHSKVSFWKQPTHWNLTRQKGQNGVKNTKDTKKPSKKVESFEFQSTNFDKVAKDYVEKYNSLLTKKTIKLWNKDKHKDTGESTFKKRHLLSFYINHQLMYTDENFTKIEIQTSDQKEDKDEHHDEAIMNLPNTEREMDNDDHYGDEIPDEGAHANDDPYVSNTQGENMCSSNPPENTEQDVGLVPAPPQVPRITINYSRTQKKINMKLLKSTMWNSLNLENDATKEVEFGQAYNDTLRDLPSEDSKELSVALGFLTLLHLANEKSLTLEGSESIENIHVKNSTRPRPEDFEQ